MDHLLVRDRELAKKVSNHLGFNLDSDKFFTRVQMQRQSQHLRYDDHIPGVGLDRCGLSAPLPFSRRDWRICSSSVRWSFVKPLSRDRRWREGRSLMNSSIDICFTSSKL